MWLVSDECTWVGWKIKRLWNSCQVRTVQNGLLTAFYIFLHHSSWTLPLISSPTLTWDFFFFFFTLPLPPFLPLSPPSRPPAPFPAVCAAEQDAQGAGGVLEPAWALRPGWAGEDPGSLSGERSENISCAGRWLQGSRKDHSDLDWKANDG